MADPQTAENAPDWSQLTVELRCPRCGYDLRMLPQPRCPECGLTFNWDEVIAAARRELESPLFEYQWRRKPVRSFFGTIARALLPWRLWTLERLAVEPRVRPLIAMLLLLFLLHTAWRLGLSYAGHQVISVVYGPGGGFWQSWGRWAGMRLTAPLVSFLILGVLGWLVVLIFQQTLGRHRIRQDQVFRVLALSWVCAICWKLLAHTVSVVLWMCADSPYISGWPGQWALCIGEWAALLLLAISLCTAFSFFLKLRHGWVIGLLASALPVLACWTMALAVTSFIYDSFSNPFYRWADAAWPGIWYTLGWLRAWPY